MIAPVVTKLTATTVAVVTIWFAANAPAYSQSHNNSCTGVINRGIRLTRAQLARLNALQPPVSSQTIREIVGDRAYCRFPDVAALGGGTIQRFAFPMEWDPENWVLLLFQGENYIGLDFSFDNGYPQ